MDANGLPEWVQWIAGGAAITVVGIIGRLGWKGQTPQTSAVEIAGGIITNQAAHDIITAIEDASESYDDNQKENREIFRDLVEAVRRLSEEVRMLAREVRERSR